MKQKQKSQWNKKNTDRNAKPKNEKNIEFSKENKATFLGNKTKRNIDDIHTNSKDTFKEHVNKNKTRIKKGQRLSQFYPKNKSNFAQKGKPQNNEENEENDEDSSSKDHQIDLNEEESDIEEKTKQQYHNKKKRQINEKQGNDIETNEIKENISSDVEESFESKNINNRNENANYQIVKKNDNPNPDVASREEFNALKENFEKLSNSFENFKKKMAKLIRVQGEINYQNEKYIQNNLCAKIRNLEYKYKIFINS